MKKSLLITGVRLILNIEKPIVVFEVANHEPIVRNPKQALTDLQNSGRGLEIDTRLFANGIENVNPYAKAQFQKALLRTRGAIIEGDFSVVKAGEKYFPNDTHPVFTDKNHPQFGTIQKGEGLIADKGGVYVEGFCTIAETDTELDREANANAYAQARVAMSSAFASIPLPTMETLDTPESVVPTATASEAFAETTPPATATKATAK